MSVATHRPPSQSQAPSPQTPYSAGGLLSLLDEDASDPAQLPLLRFALQQLHQLVDVAWAEVSERVDLLEELSEDEGFPADDRQLAAAVASKCYYHLEEYDDALRLALCAGKHFDVDRVDRVEVPESAPAGAGGDEYVRQIVSKCIDKYVAQKRNAHDLAQQQKQQQQQPGEGGLEETDVDAASAALSGSVVSDAADTGSGSGEGGDRTVGDNTEAVATGEHEASELDGQEPQLQHGDDAVVEAGVLAVVERMYQKCYRAGHFRQAIGVAFEAHDLPKIEATLAASGNSYDMLGHCFRLCQTSDSTRGFRTSVLKILARKYQSLHEPDYINVCQCLQYLNDAKGVAAILCEMARGDDLKLVKALQVAFILVENQNQQFMLDICAALELPRPQASVEVPEAAAPAEEEGEEGEEASTATPATGVTAATSNAAQTESRKRRKDGEEGAPAHKKASMGASPRPTMSEEYIHKVEQLRKVLDGSETAEAHLAFLCRNNMMDLLLLDKIRDATTKARNFSVLHNATVIAHAYMNAGTTSDKFLRSNLQWLGHATNWARFTAVAALGVVHKGNVKDSMKILDPYLPKADGAPASDRGQTFAEGGALFALGLMHANKYDQEKISYMEGVLNRSTNPTHVHGACLGLGFAGMSAGTESHIALLQETLYQHEDAVAGEAAALTMGLLNMGAGGTTAAARKAMEIMLPHAHATDHEKIIRGHAVGLALIMYQQEESALTLIHTLTRDKDPILRYGGVFTIGLAYCGTANNSQIARLLHIAVSDVSNDVKRAAVTMLGFVMLKNPDKVPQLVSLLSHSYSPHIRYGAAMAVGVACSGTSLPSALEILNPLLKDSVDYVRSAAHICKAMVIMQDAPKYQPFADSLMEIINGKTPSTLPKAGAIIAHGILNAGGRNVTISLVSQAGHRMQAAIAGMTLWLNHWYWYPYYNALSLAFAPTVLMGFNKDLKIPSDFAMTCNARPSLFAYPEPLKAEVEEKKERIETVTLSTTAAAQARKRKKDAANGGEKPAASSGSDTASGDSTAEKESNQAQDASGDNGKEKSGDEKDKVAKEKVKEPKLFRVENPGRVTQRQRPFMASLEGRYRPVMPNVHSGIVMLVDTQPDDDETFVDFSKPLNPKIKVPGEEDEPSPPAPFIWRPSNK